MHLTKEDTIAVPSPGASHDTLKDHSEGGGPDLIMAVDTGASVTVISEAMRRRIWPTQPALPLHPTNVKLSTYTKGGDPSAWEADG